MAQHIIGISGTMGVGKDTSADVLVSKFGFVKVSLADEMKRICKRVFGFSDEQLWGPSEKRNQPDERFLRPSQFQNWLARENQPKHLTPRFALQTLGTEWGRRCYESVWVDDTLRTVTEVLAGHPYTPSHGLGSAWIKKEERPAGVVIPDVRFGNEVAAINAAGGRVWKLVRPDADASSTHASETSLDTVAPKEFDRVILNTGSLTDFRETIEVIGRQLFDTGVR